MNRESLVFMAKLAEQAERYSENQNYIIYKNIYKQDSVIDQFSI